MSWPVKLPVARAPRDSNVTADQALAVPPPTSVTPAFTNARHLRSHPESAV